MKTPNPFLFIHAPASAFTTQENEYPTIHQTLPMGDVLFATQAGSGAGGGKNTQSASKDQETSQSEKSDNRHDQVAENSPAGKAKDKKNDDVHSSITDADSPLMGDTGNSDIGQTDLGASGTGAEDIDPER